MYVYIIERSLAVKLPTIWTDGKAEVGRFREEKRRETVRKKKMQVREKVEKSRNTVFFPMICGTSGSKSRLAKAAGAKPSGQMRDEQLHAVVARSTFPSKNVQNHSRTTFGSSDDEKVHALWREAHFQVKMYKAHQPRSTFGS